MTGSMNVRLSCRFVEITIICKLLFDRPNANCSVAEDTILTMFFTQAHKQNKFYSLDRDLFEIDLKI